MADSAEPTSIEFRRRVLLIEPERFHCLVPNDDEYLGTDPERDDPPDDEIACSYAEGVYPGVVTTRALLVEDVDEFEIVLRGIRSAAREEDEGTRAKGGVEGLAEVAAGPGEPSSPPQPPEPPEPPDPPLTPPLTPPEPPEVPARPPPVAPTPLAPLLLLLSM